MQKKTEKRFLCLYCYYYYYDYCFVIITLPLSQ